MKRLRIYIDASVVGGYFDPAFAEVSVALFERARKGEVVFVVSDLLVEELEGAPARVQELLASVPVDSTEEVTVNPEAEGLRDAYLSADVVSSGSAADALHVALATITRADVIVSWNFRHIVHLEKIRGFNAVNLREGYAAIEIRSPREVV